MSENKPVVRRRFFDEALLPVFGGLQSGINRLFDDFLKGVEWPSLGWAEGEGFPKVDVKENGQEVTVVAELPGVEAKEIDLSIHEGWLVIKGEKKQEKEEKGENRYRMERSFGSFARTVALPASVDESKVDASFKNGVLTVRIAKAKDGKDTRKKIAIKSA